MKVNIKSIIIAAITFVLFLTGSLLVVNKCSNPSNDIAIVGDTLMNHIGSTRQPGDLTGLR